MMEGNGQTRYEGMGLERWERDEGTVKQINRRK